MTTREEESRPATLGRPSQGWRARRPALASLGAYLVPRSIVGWFGLGWAVFLVGAVVVGALLVSLYEQSTAERLRRAEAAVAHGCDAIAGRYRFLVAGATG